MRIIPSPTILRDLTYYIKVFGKYLIVWLLCKGFLFIFAIIAILLAIKYAGYIPGNPNYKHNYDARISVPANPLTEAPKYKTQSEIEAETQKK